MNKPENRYDNDGWLDLFVVNYAHWTPDFDRYCGERDRNLRVYCQPKYFEGLSNTLYHNRRDGTFEAVSVKSGIAAHIGRGMSVAFADYDNDGFTDVFVTNDNMPIFCSAIRVMERLKKSRSRLEWL